MAFLSKIVIAASAFAALSAARPLAIRDVTEIVTDTAWTTIDVPVTLWVDEKGTPLSTVAAGGNFAASASPVATTESAQSSSATASPVAAQPQVIQSSALPSVPQAAPVVPTTTAAPQATAAPETSAYVPTQAPAASPSSPSASAVPTNNAQSGQTGSTGSTSGTCEGSGNACSGDITHYDGGLGACGWNVNTASDMQIALPYGFMGTQSNGNPYCGKSLTIKNPTTGQTAQATVGDKCMGCEGRSIDLTDALFNAVGGGCDGRCSGFDWWFN